MSNDPDTLRAERISRSPGMGGESGKILLLELLDIANPASRRGLLERGKKNGELVEQVQVGNKLFQADFQ